MVLNASWNLRVATATIAGFEYWSALIHRCSLAGGPSEDNSTGQLFARRPVVMDFTSYRSRRESQFASHRSVLMRCSTQEMGGQRARKRAEKGDYSKINATY